MLDQKIENQRDGNRNSAACPFCGIGRVQLGKVCPVCEADPELLAHLCLSTLHFGPRSWGNLINAGFKQDVKKFQPRDAESKAIVANRRDQMMADFKANGMPICESRAGGAGVCTPCPGIFNLFYSNF